MTDGVSDEVFARYVVAEKLATVDQIRAARHAQALSQQSGMTLPLPDVLVADQVLTLEQRDQALQTIIGQGAIVTLGKYKLLKELGRGGMGKVFLAEDTLAGRQVAVKVLSGKLAENHDFIKRFKREAKATGKLNHANIIAAYDAGEDQGRHYYAMEYCAGQPLAKVLRRIKRMPWQRAAAIVTQVAEGLKHAHENGVLHRDIKPDNIFVTTEDTVKILDLGLSKDVEDASESFHTQGANAIGTPHYMAPEQAKGEKLDCRADIYGLGATFYHLVAGEPPFSGNTAATIMLKHLTDDVPNPQDAQSDIPDGVVAVIWKMMARSPAERYRNCDQLLGDLHRVMAGLDPESVGSSDTLERVPRASGESEGAAVEVAERPARASGYGVGVGAAVSRTKTPPEQNAVRRVGADRVQAQTRSKLLGILCVGGLILIGCGLVVSMFSRDKLTPTAIPAPAKPSETAAQKDPSGSPGLPPVPPAVSRTPSPSGSDLVSETAQLERKAQDAFDALEKKLAKLPTVDQKVAAITGFEKEYGDTIVGSRARILKAKLTAPPAPPPPATPPPAPVATPDGPANPPEDPTHAQIRVASKEQADALSAILEHARVASEAKDYAGAIADLDKLVKMEPNQYALFHNRASMKWYLGDITGTLADTDQAIALGSKAWQTWLLRAMACYGLSRDAECRKALETAAQMSQQPIQQLEQQVQQDASRVRVLQAGKAFETKTPESAADFLARGNARQESGRLAEAADDLKEAIRRDPSIGERGGYMQLYTVTRQMKNYRGMMKVLKQWADSKPDSVQGMNAYAWELLCCPDNSLRDPKLALQYSEKGAELTKHADPMVLDTLALAYSMNGKPAIAVATEEKAITLLPANTAPQSRKEYEDRLKQFRDALPR